MRDAHAAGTLTLIGSGEMAPSMSKVHRAVAARAGGTPRTVFVDTPAGFEPNVDDVAAKAVAYYTRHLGRPCAVASFRQPEDPTEHAAAQIAAADVIFAGPGSPTYAISMWRESPVFAALCTRLDQGAQVVLASAAAIACSSHALPVYEIYKAGAPLGWAEGLGLLADRGIQLAVVPHWNNGEGAGYDTTRCFMGAARFARLRALLPAEAVVLGIDEHTACTLDLAAGTAQVLGAGGVTIVHGAGETRVESGASFDIALLRTRESPPAHLANARPATEDETPLDAAAHAAMRSLNHDEPPAVRASAALALATAIDRASRAGAPAAALDEGRRALQALVARWHEELGGATGADAGPLVELLLDVRGRLRAARNFELSDMIRDALQSMGLVVEDTRVEAPARGR